MTKKYKTISPMHWVDAKTPEDDFPAFAEDEYVNHHDRVLTFAILTFIAFLVALAASIYSVTL